MIKTSIVCAAMVGAVLSTAALAQPPVPAMPDDVKAIRMSGVGLKVSNLERSMKFYTEVLGFKVASRVPAQGGPAREYLLGLTGNVREDTLVVLTEGKIEPGATTFGRVVLVVPSGRKMSERVRASGVPQTRPLADGTNIVTDPDGYVIELYQRPAAPAPK